MYNYELPDLRMDFNKGLNHKSNFFNRTIGDTPQEMRTPSGHTR